MHTPALSSWQILLRVMIVIFCVWHMFAVFIFSIPRAATDTFADSSRRLLLPIVIPYMQTTSQWELWDVFAPEPLRLISLYQIEKQDGDTWIEIETIKPGGYPFWQHANYFKYLTNIVSSTDENTRGARERFLQLQCPRLHVPDGTTLRLSIRTTLLPWLLEPTGSAWWNNWSPEWSSTPSIETVCFSTQES